MRTRELYFARVNEEQSMQTPDSPPNQTDSVPKPETPEVVNYATAVQLRSVAKTLEQSLPNGSFKTEPAGGVKRIPHIRAQKISTSELREVMSSLGAVVTSPDATQAVLSGKFPVHSFSIADTIYSIVIGSVKGAGGEESVGLNRKELAPTGLGLDGKSYNKIELADATKKAVAVKIRDEGLKSALMSLVDNAAAGGQGALPPELAKEIAPLVGIISQDFGEILAPLVLMNDEDIAELPSGNNPIVDVVVKGMKLSVKALTGSGTSFKTVADLMDQYELSILGDEKKSQLMNVLKQFHPKTGGKNVDKIIRAAAAAKIPEYNTLCSILGGKELNGYGSLLKAVTSFTRGMDYGTFIRSFYPAMIAGEWGKPVGLPADGSSYLSNTPSKTPKKEKAAGKNSYNAKPGVGATDILTYVLGVGLLNYVRRGVHAAEYSSMMTDIVRKSDAVIGHITVNPNGSMSVKTLPFSNLKFEFQYHAPSHIPGNNLPGFMYVAD